jgi:Domain of unknown function (DUF3387)
MWRFFQAVRVVLAKRAPATPGRRKVDHAVRQIISRAVAPEGGVNIFAGAGLRKEHRAARSFAEMLEQTIRIVSE